MSLNSSREKSRLFSRGSSTFSLETPKDPIPLDRSISTPSFIGQSLSSSSSTRSEPMLLPMTKRSDFLPSVKPAKPWFSTHESTDLGVVPEDVSEDTSYLTPNEIPLNIMDGGNGRFPSAYTESQQHVWYEVQDANSDKTFYFDSVTGVSQWEAPEGVKAIPINQRGVAIIFGNGVIEKNYMTAVAKQNNEFVNANGHIYDPIQYTRREVFSEEDENHSEMASSIAEEISPKQDIVGSLHEERIAYSTFVETNFNYYRRGLFRRRTTTKRLMTFKPTPIHLPLLKSALPYKQDCIELNKKILQYVTAVNVNPSGRSVVNDYHNLREILHIVMNNYKELQNECYCQVLKVMTGSNQLTVVAAWDILAVLCGTIAPTESLMYHIITECIKGKDNKNFHSLPTQSIELLKHTMIMKPRTVIPTNAEINAILNNEYVAIRVYLYNNNYIMLQAHAGMTVEEVEHIVADRLHILEYEHMFCLYECRYDGVEHKCQADEQIFVYLSQWQTEYSSNHYKRNSIHYHFLYHAIQFIDFDRNNSNLLNLMYMQGVHDVTSGLYPCTEVDLITLLAISLKAKYGDSIITEEQYKEAFEKNIPTCYHNDSLFEKLKKFCHKLKNREHKWYLCAYVDYLMNWELYGIVCYPVETIGRSDMRQKSILAIGMHGVFILQSETKMIQREIPFDAIPCWGYTNDSVVLYVGSFVHQEKLMFETKYGKDINDLLQNYITYLTEQLESNGEHP